MGALAAPFVAKIFKIYSFKDIFGPPPPSYSKSWILIPRIPDKAFSDAVLEALWGGGAIKAA